MIARSHFAAWRRTRRLAALAATACLAHAPDLAAAPIDVERGDEAPAITLPRIDGGTVTTSGMGGRILVLLFGETGQDRTLEALRLIDVAIEDPRLDRVSIRQLLVLSKGSRPDEIEALLSERSRPIVVAHDERREAFGAWGVIALPSVAVVDEQGRIAHAIAGLTPRFGDAVRDALLVVSGKLGVDELARAPAEPDVSEADEIALRGKRLTRLARRLVRVGMVDAAEAKLREAIALDPALAPTRLELGRLLLRSARIDEAEQEFRAVLALEPESVDAACGLAEVRIRRGGDALDGGLTLVDDLLAKHPEEPRAHYLRGLIQQHRGELAEAAAAFREAAELLMAEEATAQ